jgi:hypothetical protein
MHLSCPHPLQLTYCTNIHPSNGWARVLENLDRYAPALRLSLAPEAPFGLGLRLSGLESAELLAADRLARFREWLAARGLYVFTLNGFPHGPFHNQPVKAQVHAPDWRDPERAAYSIRLTTILAALLPVGGEGSISTSPLSYKAWVNQADEAAWSQITEHVVLVAAAMARVREQQGKLICLAIEPEPDGLLENSHELLAFYEQHLLTYGARSLAAELGVGLEQARELLLEHVRVCFDTCHVAVAYERPATVLARFGAAGIKVGKVQVSSALCLDLDLYEHRASLAQALAPLAESTYLHQVVQRNRDGSITQYPDLPEALLRLDDKRAAEWRIHFHVPIFLERYGLFTSTQSEILETFALLRERPFTQHLEIETYTWAVLPPALKLDLRESLEREYRWALRQLQF